MRTYPFISNYLQSSGWELVRAQLSSDELFLLFYNCLSKVGLKKFKPLVEEFAMLQHVPRESLILPEHMELYNQRAFGEAE